LFPKSINVIIEKEVSDVYEAFDSREQFRISRYPGGHLESAAMRAEILDYLDKYL